MLKQIQEQAKKTTGTASETEIETPTNLTGTEDVPTSAPERGAEI